MTKLEEQFNYIKQQSWFLEFIHYIVDSKTYTNTTASIVDLIVWEETNDCTQWYARDTELSSICSSCEEIFIDDVIELIKKSRRNNIELFI